MKPVPNVLYDIDNCLLCKDATIHENAVAGFIAKMGFVKFAAKLNDSFPVVTCNREYGKYVTNPMHRPGWCNRGRK